MRLDRAAHAHRTWVLGGERGQARPGAGVDHEDTIGGAVEFSVLIYLNEDKAV